MREMYIDEDISIMENPVNPPDNEQHSDTSSCQGSPKAPPNPFICDLCGKDYHLHICP